MAKTSVGVKAAWIISGLGLAGVIIAAIINLFGKSQPTTATIGNNSPATVFSATTSGSNSPITQSVNNIGYPTNEIEEIRMGQREILRRMAGFKEEKKDDPNFNGIFPDGYILFTATGRKEIIQSQPSAMDEIEFNWKAGYSVELTPTNILMHLPEFNIRNQMHYEIGSFVLPRVVGMGTSPIGFNGKDLTFIVVSTNTDGDMIAVGFTPHVSPNDRRKKTTK